MFMSSKWYLLYFHKCIKVSFYRTGLLHPFIKTKQKRKMRKNQKGT